MRPRLRLPALLMTALAAGGATLLLSPARADDIAGTSRIEEVTVFPRGAEIARVVRIKVPAGNHTVILRDLPADAVASSIRVEGKASGRLELGTVDNRRFALPLDQSVSAERKAIEDEIERRGDQIASLKAEIETRETQKAFIGNLSQLPTRPASPPPPGSAPVNERWSDILALIGTSSADVHRALINARLNIRGIEREIVDLRRRLAALAPRQENRTEVRINLAAAAALEAVLTVRYQVGRAGWLPEYDARLMTGSRTVPPKLTITRRATIRQRTSEAWTDVALRLSTVKPSGGTAAPNLSPVMVDFRQPPPPPVPMASSAPRQRYDMAARKARPMAEAEAAPAVAAAPMEEAVDQGVAVDAGTFQAEFQVPGRITVPNTNEQKQVKLGETALEPALAVRAVPKQDPRAFLYAKFALPKGIPFLAGQLSLFRDQTFVGLGRMPQKAGGDEHEMGFGTDDSIRIKYAIVNEKRGETGLISSSRTDVRNYSLAIKNLHERPMAFTIIDQVPVSLNQEIKVDLIGRTTPTRRDLDGQRGVLAWDDKLAPDEERTIEFGYRVTWPTGKDIEER